MTDKPREILGIDFETASHADIKVGSAAYAEHPTTRVLCAVFVLQTVGPDGALVRTEWRWRPGEEVPRKVVEWVKSGRPVLAHNIAFEHEIIKAGHVPGLPLPKIEQWHDTMALAAALNLPQSLDGLTQALGVKTVKDMEGHRLMMKMCKLDAEGKHVHKVTPADFLRLLDYCALDVYAMLAAYNAMPGLLPAERQTWINDTKINARGCYVDIHFVERLATMAGLQKNYLIRKMREASNLEAAAPAHVKAFAKRMGVALPKRKRAGGEWTETLDAAACEELLESAPELPPGVAEVLRLKIEMGRLTSLSKLNAVSNMRAADERVKWQLRFCGGSQTGRWSAKGLQLHNVPKDRRKRAHSELVRELIDSRTHHMLQRCEPNVLEALSLCLRSMVAAPPGKDLIGADYSAIEARVLPWLAFDHKKLDVFRSGVDIYVLSAQAVGSDVRNLGKVQELALQFGMGAIKFADTALGYGVELELKEARRIQRLWRERNPLTVEFWRDIETTARDLILGKPGRAAPVGRCTLRRTADRLMIELPSGRSLSYRHPRIAHGEEDSLGQ